MVETIQPPAGHDVVCRFFCIPQPLHEGLPVARWLFAGYATVPVYEAFFRQLGWGTAIDPMVAAWRAGDRKQAAELAPEELLREVFVFGGPGAMRERLLEFAGAGVTTLCLMPLVRTGRAAGADRRPRVSVDLVTGEDGRARCGWGASTPDYAVYHDDEWGRPVHDADALYEKLCLEAFQSGLSWLTILRKREHFRAAFAGFEIDAVAAFGRRRRRAADGRRGHRPQPGQDRGGDRQRARRGGGRRPRRADLVVRARPRARPAPRSFADVPAVTPESTATGQGAQAARLPLRRADHRVRADAGVRAGQRPPRGLLGAMSFDRLTPARRARRTSGSRRSARRERARDDRPFVYLNMVSSVDGRARSPGARARSAPTPTRSC